MSSAPIAPTGEHAIRLCEILDGMDDALRRIADATERMDQRQSEVDAASDAQPCCAEALALLITARKLLRQAFDAMDMPGFVARDEWGAEVLDLAPKIGEFMKEHS